MRLDSKLDEAWDELAAVLDGETRRAIVNELASAKTLGHALRKARQAAETHVWAAGPRAFSVRALVRHADSLARQHGFHALHDWDGPSKAFKTTTIPTDVLTYLIDQRGDEPPDRSTLAISLDYYFFYVLAVLAVAACLQDEADRHLDRVAELLALLQGSGDSGQRFVDDVGTLILVATSHYEPDERGFATLLERVRALDERHRTPLALVHADSLGCHLRFGFDVTYGRDTIAMRDDNVADYPWLCFALATLARAWLHCREQGEESPRRRRIVEALFAGLTPDARAFVGESPASLAAYRDDWTGFREVFEAYRQDLLEEFATQDPTGRPYSPLAFSYNFAQNIVKGTVVDALLRKRAWSISLNDLLTGLAPEPELAGRRELAETLAQYARDHPDWIRGAWRPVILYDPQAGRRAFRLTMEKLRA